jgi:hypothetical protein
LIKPFIEFEIEDLKAQRLCGADFIHVAGDPRGVVLFLVRVELLPDPLSRFVRKPLRDRLCHFLRMFVGRMAQKSDLFSVAAAPFTEQEMNTQAEPAAQRELVV